jgi:hypothetical protein
MSGRNAKLIRRVARELNAADSAVADALKVAGQKEKAQLRGLHPPRQGRLPDALGRFPDTSLRSAQTGSEHNALNVSVSQRGVSR